MRSQLHHLIAAAADRHGARPALTFDDTTVSYERLWREVVAFGSGLRSLGLRRRDRVAVYLDKRIETVVAIFGSSAARGVFVPVNPLLRPEQVRHILNDCDVRVLVTSHERFELLRDELPGCPSVERVIVLGRPEGAAPQHPAVSSWSDVVAADAPADPELERGLVDLDMAAILYTSGSTGKPKGVVLSHRNLIVGAESVSAYLANTAEDRILAALPLSFDAGFSQLTTAFHVGAQAVLVNYLLPRDIVALCARHAITGLTCVPPLWVQLAEQEWPEEASARVRYIANTGGRMPRATLRQLRGIFTNARPFLMYGLTEAFRSTYLDPAEVERRPDSIGKAIPNAEILVVREDGSLCGPGEEGELVHRGALVAMGYWNDPVRTAERFREAPGREPGLCTPEMSVWSGDVVMQDEDGFLYFVSRRDEMIKTSGYRVSPTEIEEVVYDTGLVRDAVALGLEDERIGQHIALVVSPKGNCDIDTDALLAEMRRRLPGYMVPRRVTVRSALPRSPNDKFDRNLLRQELLST